MHHDDWFSNPESLEIFYDSLIHNNVKFAFSQSRNVHFDERITNGYLNNPSLESIHNFISNPLLLYKENIIGAPSAVIFFKDTKLSFDKNLKWFVDCKFYIDYLSKCNFKFGIINSEEICIGISHSQVTNSCQTPDIILFELIYCLQNSGFDWIKNYTVINLLLVKFKYFGIDNFKVLNDKVKYNFCIEIKHLLEIKDNLRYMRRFKFFDTLIFFFYLFRIRRS
jgi:hypothetical protein